MSAIEIGAEIVIRRRIMSVRRTWAWEMELSCGHTVCRASKPSPMTATARCERCERKQKLLLPMRAGAAARNEKARLAVAAATERVEVNMVARPSIDTHRRAPNKQPKARLRLIVGETTDGWGNLDVLECGHTKRRAVGGKPRTRMYCRLCVTSPWSIRKESGC